VQPAIGPERQAAPQQPLIVLLGPTAVGKTELSLLLCEHIGGEIVGADSRQIYRGMAIGTALVGDADRVRAPHHLIDFCAPDETLTVAAYQRLAYAVIDDIHRRGAVPVLTGGTALYVRAVTEGLRIPEVPPNSELRAEMEETLRREGREALFERLRSLDPATAAVIDRNNPRRVMRALEIVISTGKSKIELEGATPPPYQTLLIGLDRPRDELYARIDRRVDEMVELGLVEETRRLLAAGYDARLPSMTGLGYREITAYLRGELTLDEAVARIKTETHRYVRHQYTWFRRMAGVQWFDMQAEDSPQRIMALAETFLAGGNG